MNTITATQFGELVANIARRFPRDVDGVAVQSAIENTDHGFWADLNRHFAAKTPEELAARQLTEWVALYASVGITLDPATVVIPPHQDGFNRLIVVPKGMTTQKAYDLCAGKFPCWKYADNSLDTAVPTNDRDANPPAGGGAYAIWVRDTIEADECHKNKSADMLTQEGVKGITLMERLLLEYKYFTETGKHLDIKSVTLCSGSRGRAGSVPYVGWNDSKLEVCWCSADGRHDFLRAREAVSL